MQLSIASNLLVIRLRSFYYLPILIGHFDLLLLLWNVHHRSLIWPYVRSSSFNEVLAWLNLVLRRIRPHVLLRVVLVVAWTSLGSHVHMLRGRILGDSIVGTGHFGKLLLFMSIFTGLVFLSTLVLLTVLPAGVPLGWVLPWLLLFWWLDHFLWGTFSLLISRCKLFHLLRSHLAPNLLLLLHSILRRSSAFSLVLLLRKILRHSLVQLRLRMRLVLHFHLGLMHLVSLWRRACMPLSRLSPVGAAFHLAGPLHLFTVSISISSIFSH